MRQNSSVFHALIISALTTHLIACGSSESGSTTNNTGSDNTGNSSADVIISGPEADIIGSGFTAKKTITDYNDPGNQYIFAVDLETGSTSSVERVIEVNYTQGSNQPNHAKFTYRSDTDVYHYGIGCYDPGWDCSGLVIDTDNYQVSFDNVPMQPLTYTTNTGNVDINKSRSNITLDGRFTYTP